MVAVSHVSNALARESGAAIVDMAHNTGTGARRRGAGRTSHEVDLRALNADFYAFSGHKIFGPRVLESSTVSRSCWSHASLSGGGDMILTVTLEKSTYNDLPYKFEAGTPNIAGGIGLGAAFDYVTRLGIETLAAWEHELLL